MSSRLTETTSPTKPRSRDSTRAVLPFDFLQQLLAEEKLAVLAAEPDGPAAVAVDQPDHLFVDLADQDHLDDRHGLGIGDAHAADEFGDDPVLLQGLVDLRPAAMDDHRIEADVLEEDDILGEGLLEPLVRHGVAAVLDDDRRIGETLDVRQRLHQHLGFIDQLLHRILRIKKIPAEKVELYTMAPGFKKEKCRTLRRHG